MRSIALVLLVATSAHAGPRDQPGWPLYERFCLPCHGERGDGHGPGAPFSRGRPRDFTRGNFEWRSTPTGQPPIDDDLRATLRFGAPGTSMPAFGDVLSAWEIDRVIDVVKAFAPRTFGKAPKPIALGTPRPIDVARGVELWAKLGCVKCHGATGHGDGPSAAGLDEKPYDLVTERLHRPRASDDADARRRAAALSIAAGMGGTPMPGYLGAVPDSDLWALADRVVALGVNAKDEPARIDDEARDEDRKHPLEIGGAPLAPQGPPLPQLAPAQASLSAQQCARCHPKQVREWRPSIHGAALSPGWRAQVAAHGAPADRCERCHAPLAEQKTDAQLRSEGVTCAGCHLRGWVRNGPPRVPSTLLAAPGYPLVEDARYERADFCLPCHQLPPRTEVAGKPLLDTYREWLEGPYMRRGIQCQHCHMANREHQWLGVHDRDTFRQAIRLDVTATRAQGGKITVVADLRNIGAGHFMPTTPTPAAWLRVELVDSRGATIADAHAEQRIGRDIYDDDKGWHERADTRIAPGASVALARAWSGGRTAAAAVARVTVEVHPDDFYERLYERQLATKLAADVRAQYQQALARARGSRYIAEQRDVSIAVSSQGP